jgi:hypothetical protein
MPTNPEQKPTKNPTTLPVCSRRQSADYLDAGTGNCLEPVRIPEPEDIDLTLQPFPADQAAVVCEVKSVSIAFARKPCSSAELTVGDSRSRRPSPERIGVG